ncbi:MAG: co-chaperone GroES [Phycisphaeraceae bacterium]|nr:co-chaperone GroES [Phycisphaeraceae bacterium]MCB9848091.1 co-chaperone GroES [Phycisphaeraceae bacterium]
MAATKTATKSRKTTKLNIRPLGDKVIVQRDEADSITESGIYLPEQAKDTPKTGVVLAVGDGALNTDTGERIPLTVSKGDRVVFSSYAGSEVKLDDQELLIMTESEILAIID